MNRELLCTLGKLDIPSVQEQPNFMVDLFQSNILLIGSAGSGKTNFIKVLIAEIHRQLEKTDIKEQIFILDAADSLKKFLNGANDSFDDYSNGFHSYPLVSAHYDFSNEEYIKRVFYKIEKQYAENVKALNGLQFYSLNANNIIPHTTLIIDNINSFLDIKHNEKYVESLIRLARDGKTKGISLVITGSSTKGLTSLLNYFPQKIALNLSSEECLNLFTRKVPGNRKITGRGYGNVTFDSIKIKRTYPYNDPYELQIFLMDDSVSYDGKIATERCPDKLTRFPLTLKESNYTKYLSADIDNELEYEPNDIDVVIGVEYTKCQKVTTHFSTSRVLAIYGKRNDEKPLLTKRLLKRFKDNKEKKYTFILVDDGRAKLKALKNELEVPDKYYFSKLRSPIIEYEGAEKHKLMVIQQFIEFVHLNLLDLKELSRSYNSKTPVLSAAMPGKYALAAAKIESGEMENCVFIIQAKDFFSNSMPSNAFWGEIFPYMTLAAETYNWFFFFTDAQRIPNVDLQNHFNQQVNTAILLDDIAEFVSDRGRRSVFGEMDVKELKEQFGQCEENDAYFYQINTAELCKIKCIREDEDNGIRKS